MTVTDTQENPAPPAARPQFRFGGTYAVYLTPAGGLHISFRKSSVMNDDTGMVERVQDAEDEHMPEVPPAFVTMLQTSMETGKRPSPAEVFKILMNGAG